MSIYFKTKKIPISPIPTKNSFSLQKEREKKKIQLFRHGNLKYILIVFVKPNIDFNLYD